MCMLQGARAGIGKAVCMVLKLIALIFNSIKDELPGTWEVEMLKIPFLHSSSFLIWAGTSLGMTHTLYLKLALIGRK